MWAFQLLSPCVCVYVGVHVCMLAPLAMTLPVRFPTGSHGIGTVILTGHLPPRSTGRPCHGVSTRCTGLVWVRNRHFTHAHDFHSTRHVHFTPYITTSHEPPSITYHVMLPHIQSRHYARYGCTCISSISPEIRGQKTTIPRRKTSSPVAIPRWSGGIRGTTRPNTGGSWAKSAEYAVRKYSVHHAAPETRTWTLRRKEKRK